MSFREKMHWASLIAILLGFGSYFVTLAVTWSRGMASPDYYLGYLFAVIGAVLAVMTISAVAFAIHKPDDSEYEFDERDRDIHRRGTHAAYYILVIGMWLVALSAHIGHGLFFMLNAMLGILVASELIRIGRQLYIYRRGY